MFLGCAFNGLILLWYLPPRNMGFPLKDRDEHGPCAQMPFHILSSILNRIRNHLWSFQNIQNGDVMSCTKSWILSQGFRWVLPFTDGISIFNLKGPRATSLIKVPWWKELPKNYPRISFRCPGNTLKRTEPPVYHHKPVLPILNSRKNIFPSTEEQNIYGNMRHNQTDMSHMAVSEKIGVSKNGTWTCQGKMMTLSNINSTVSPSCRVSLPSSVWPGQDHKSVWKLWTAEIWPAMKTAKIMWDPPKLCSWWRGDHQRSTRDKLFKIV